MEFVQIVDYESDRPDDIRALGEQWQTTGRSPQGGPTRVTIVQDRDNPRHFLTIAEFVSYDEAMANNARPETNDFAARLRSLTTRDPRFTNLDVVTRERT
jgi:quinol monooxygenase YgiN